MPYTIEVKFSTSDSERKYEEEYDIGLIWNDKQLAIKALSFIKEQHQLYQKLDSTYDRQEREKLIQSIISKEWIDQNKTLQEKKDHWQYSLSVLMDDGSNRSIRTNWLSYGSTLYQAKIIKITPEEEIYIPN